MPRANRSYRPLCSPWPWTTAKVIRAPGTGQARYASLVPSEEVRKPLLACAPSGAKVTEPAEDLERLLLGLEQSGGVSADPAECVGPLGARRALGMEPESRRVEEDSLALDLLDHRSFGEDVFE